MKGKILIHVIVFFVGLVLGLFLLQLFNIHVSTSRTYGVVEVVYYLVAPIGVLATIAAVIVALFGDDIRRLINKEKCSVSLERDNFTEDISGQEGALAIEARRYDCGVVLKNVGSREIENCCVYIVSCKHKEDSQGKWRDLKIKNKIPLYWRTPGRQKETLLVGERKSLLLFRINPDGDQSTPDDNNAVFSTRRLSIIGFSPDIKYRQKGYWEVDYSLCTPHNELLKFRLIVSWTGVWHQREKEMNEETTVKLEIIK